MIALVDEYSVAFEDWESREDLHVAFSAVDHVYAYKLSGAGATATGTVLDYKKHSGWFHAESNKTVLMWKYSVRLFEKAAQSRVDWLSELKWHMAR
jgi:hypothetical protein